MMVSIYAIFQNQCISVQIIVIILVKVMEAVINFVIFHMVMNLNVFAKILIITSAIKIVLFMEKQVDAIRNAL
jgi:hypothetical protein